MGQPLPTEIITPHARRGQHGMPPTAVSATGKTWTDGRIPVISRSNEKQAGGRCWTIIPVWTIQPQRPHRHTRHLRTRGVGFVAREYMYVHCTCRLSPRRTTAVAGVAGGCLEEIYCGHVAHGGRNFPTLRITSSTRPAICPTEL